MASDLGQNQDSDGQQPNTTAAQQGDNYPKMCGLPSDPNLHALAKVYLTEQRRLWPNLAEMAVLPEDTDESLTELVSSFQDRYRSGEVVPFAPVDEQAGGWLKLAASYLRYSSDNQIPRSLDDLLSIQLKRAKEHDVFIPWHYVFADAGLSGTKDNRPGYHLAKQVLRLEGAGAIDILYVDELSRATRNAAEALKLTETIRFLDKRLIGVSDGIDTNDSSARMKITLYAGFNEETIERLRSRVIRGQKGAAKRGTVIGKLPFGLKMVTVMENGVPVLGGTGKPMHRYTVDEEARPYIELLAKRFVEDQWTLTKIAREFNAKQVGGRTRWCGATLSPMLRNALYVGIQVYNARRSAVDPDTGKRILKKLPPSERVVRRMPETQIWSIKTWKKIKKRLDEVRDASPTGGRRRSINQIHPTTLFSGLLYCQSCGKELLLLRGGGGPKDRQFFCWNSQHERDGCKFASSKRVHFVESALLDYLRDKLLTEDRVRDLVKRANEFLKIEAAKPRIDTSGLKASLVAIQAKRDRLINMVEDGMAGDLSAVKARLKTRQLEIRDLNRQIREAETANGAMPVPVQLDGALEMLADIRSLLNGEVSSVAPILRELFGKMYVRSVEVPSERRKVWIADVRGDLVPIMSRLAKTQNRPDSLGWSNLTQQNWTIACHEEVEIKNPVPLYKSQAARAVELRQQGLDFVQIGEILGCTAVTANYTYRYGMTGKTPVDFCPSKRKRRRRTKKRDN